MKGGTVGRSSDGTLSDAGSRCNASGDRQRSVGRALDCPGLGDGRIHWHGVHRPLPQLFPAQLDRYEAGGPLHSALVDHHRWPALPASGAGDEHATGDIDPVPTWTRERSLEVECDQSLGKRTAAARSSPRHRLQRRGVRHPPGAFEDQGARGPCESRSVSARGCASAPVVAPTLRLANTRHEAWRARIPPS
jgi:hypothetical protein